MGRNERAGLAQETLRVLQEGTYRAPSGTEWSIRAELEAAVAGTHVITPGEWSSIIEAGLAIPAVGPSPLVEVTSETTLSAAVRLSVANSDRCLVLNFASAKNPGGGFLGGSQAQEESLARSSGLYATLLGAKAYYAANRSQSSKLYTDHAILSPGVPVFRADDGTFLEQPYHVTFLTMPAPNRGAMEAGSADEKEIPHVLRRRMRGLCGVAAQAGYRRLILGAWECGVFCNLPSEVAMLFRETLFGAEGWGQRFSHICFAVYDSSVDKTVFKAFQEAFEASRH